MNRGEVWLVELDPSRGHEMRKTRPALIISSDAIGVLDLRVVVPFTEWQPGFAAYPWMVRIDPMPGNGLTKPSGADGFQLKSVSTGRLRARLGSVTAAELEEVVEAVGLVIEHP
jgi:mRNA interferase MazF